MSMLDRYRKPGGFNQLLALIETCSPTKQDKLLEIISQEDRRWSETVRAKILSMDRIYSWNDEALAEVFGALQDLTVSVALHAAPENLRSRITVTFSHGRLRKLEDLKTAKGPTDQEIAATHMKIIETVRKMESDGFIRFEAIDPSLVIEDDIDKQLSQPQGPAPVHQMPSRVLHAYSPLSDHLAARGESVEATGGGSSGLSSVNTDHDSRLNESRLMEIQNLKKRVADLSKENATLRHDLSIVRSKLDQIKKIA